jgi:hypothetical protein
MVDKTSEYLAVPPDDLKRNLTIAQIDRDQSLRHIGLVPYGCGPESTASIVSTASR